MCAIFAPGERRRKNASVEAPPAPDIVGETGGMQRRARAWNIH
jgi:hypothetical protein